MKFNRNYSALIVLYLISLIIIYFLFLSISLTKNIFLRTIIFSIPILLIFVLFEIKKLDRIIPKIKNNDYLIRYDMICHKCNWQWMSHSTKRSPSQCPNCNTSQRNMLEIIGWRKLNLNIKKDKDLRNFFKA